MRREMSDLGTQRPQANDREKEYDLPVEEARLGEVAANPSVNAEVDEGREVPDFFPVGGPSAKLASEESREQIVRQRGPFAVEKSGHGKESASSTSSDAACDDRENKC